MQKFSPDYFSFPSLSSARTSSILVVPMSVTLPALELISFYVMDLTWPGFEPETCGWYRTSVFHFFGYQKSIFCDSSPLLVPMVSISDLRLQSALSGSNYLSSFQTHLHEGFGHLSIQINGPSDMWFRSMPNWLPLTKKCNNIYILWNHGAILTTSSIMEFPKILTALNCFHYETSSKCFVFLYN